MAIRQSGAGTTVKLGDACETNPVAAYPVATGWFVRIRRFTT